MEKEGGKKEMNGRYCRRLNVKSIKPPSDSLQEIQSISIDLKQS
jgi:hypothetical protein